MLLGEPLLPRCTFFSLPGTSPPFSAGRIPEHMPPLRPSPRCGGYAGGENRHEQICIHRPRRVLELEPARHDVPHRTMLTIGRCHTASHLDDVAMTQFFCKVGVWVCCDRRTIQITSFKEIILEGREQFITHTDRPTASTP